jgi:hypothetical protein
MNATINIYKDCTSEEPTKKYVCKRLLLGVSKKVQALSENMEGKSEKEQEEIIIDILKTIFPNFDAEDFNYIDPVEYFNFIKEISNETNKIMGNAVKN